MNYAAISPEVELIIPAMPELIELENGNWKVKLPDYQGTPSFLSGPEYKGGEWVWLTRGEAYASACDWWTNIVRQNFKPTITKQPRAERPWFEADRAAGYKFND